MNFIETFDFSMDSFNVSMESFSHSLKIDTYERFINTINKLKHHDYGMESLYDRYLSLEDEEQNNNENENKEQTENKPEENKQPPKDTDKKDSKGSDSPGFFRKAWSYIKQFFKRIANFVANLFRKIINYIRKKGIDKRSSRAKTQVLQLFDKEYDKLVDEQKKFINIFVMAPCIENTMETIVGLLGNNFDKEAANRLINYGKQLTFYKETLVEMKDFNKDALVQSGIKLGEEIGKCSGDKFEDFKNHFIKRKNIANEIADSYEAHFSNIKNSMDKYTKSLTLCISFCGKCERSTTDKSMLDSMRKYSKVVGNMSHVFTAFVKGLKSVDKESTNQQLNGLNYDNLTYDELMKFVKTASNVKDIKANKDLILVAVIDKKTNEITVSKFNNATEQIVEDGSTVKLKYKTMDERLTKEFSGRDMVEFEFK